MTSTTNSIIDEGHKPPKTRPINWLLMFRLSCLTVCLATGSLVVGSSIYGIVLWAPELPYWDQWDTRYEDWSLNYLFAQHNEHRVFIAKIIFNLDGTLGGQNRLLTLLLVMLPIAICYYLNVMLLERPTNFKSMTAIIFSIFILASLFNMVQFENFYSGFQIQFFGVYLAAIYAIFCANRFLENDRTPISWYVKCMLAIVVSTFCMANGLLSGLAVAFFFLVNNKGPQWRAAAGACAITVALAFIYFVTFKSPSGHTDLSFAFEQPLTFARFFFGVVGAGAGWPNAIYAGALAIVVSALLFVVALMKKSEPKVTALLAVCLFVGLSAGVVALGRSSFPVEASAASRYSTPSLILGVCLFSIAVLIANKQFAGKVIAEVFGIVVAVVGCLSILAGQSAYLGKMEAHWESLRLASSALINSSLYPQAVAGAYPSATALAERLPKIQLPKKSIFANSWASAIGTNLALWKGDSDYTCDGSFHRLQSIENVAHASGWLSRNGITPDAIFLVDATKTIKAIGLPGVPIGSYHDINAETKSSRTSWSAYFDGAKIGPRAISAFAYHEGKGLCEIRGLRSEAFFKPSIASVIQPPSVSKLSLINAIPRGGYSIVEGFAGIPSPPRNGKVWGAYGGIDGNKGELIFSSNNLSQGEFLDFFAIGGGSSLGQQIQFRNSNGQLVGVADLNSLSASWQYFRVPIPKDKTITSIVFFDGGRGAGQWQAVSDVGVTY